MTSTVIHSYPRLSTVSHTTRNTHPHTTTTVVSCGVWGVCGGSRGRHGNPSFGSTHFHSPQIGAKE